MPTPMITYAAPAIRMFNVGSPCSVCGHHRYQRNGEEQRVNEEQIDPNVAVARTEDPPRDRSLVHGVNQPGYGRYPHEHTAPAICRHAKDRCREKCQPWMRDEDADELFLCPRINDR